MAKELFSIASVLNPLLKASIQQLAAERNAIEKELKHLKHLIAIAFAPGIW